MEDAIRTPLEQLESEAVYLLRESAALFQKPALMAGNDERSQALAELAQRAFDPGSFPTSGGAAGDGHGEKIDALIGSGCNEGSFEVWPLLSKPPQGQEPWRVFPLASWAQVDIASLLGTGQTESQRRLLRVCTVGEPGSGKSTLVEGLLALSLDPKGSPPRAQHRHLTTPERRLIVVDPPGQEPSGHALMAAARAAEIALLVVDARQGLTTIGKHQAYLLALMGVPHLVAVINKMDLVDFAQPFYEKIVADLQNLSSLLEVKSISFVPVAALTSENLRHPSEAMPWHQGAPLISHLESINPGSLRNMIDFRMPVQCVQEGQGGCWQVGGRLASGRVSVGDKVVLLPSGQEADVSKIWRSQTDHRAALAGDSVTLRLCAQDLRVQSGDIVATAESLPTRSSELEAVILWLGDQPQKPETTYTLHHATRLVNAHVSEVRGCLQSETLTWEASDRLSKGQIGKVRLTTSSPLYFDSYTANRETGAIALWDSQTRAVVGAGVLKGPALELTDVTASAERLKSTHVVKDPTLVARQKRVPSYGHKAAVLWFTGLSGSGKSTVAKAVEKQLYERGCHTLFLDGDNVRSGLNGDLGFTEEARTESTRRVAELAALAFEQGQMVVCSFISGSSDDRAFARSLIPQGHFFEFFVNCPIDVCRSRDPKDLYKKADAGELLSFSGISIPYDEPEDPHLELRSDQESADDLADRVVELLENRQLLSGGRP
jgi:bifunctional enzyme CysN/CysC